MYPAGAVPSGAQPSYQTQQDQSSYLRQLFKNCGSIVNI